MSSGLARSYLDQHRANLNLVCSRWLQSGQLVALLYALADRRQPDDEPNLEKLDPEARQNLAENILSFLLEARNGYRWTWRGSNADPLVFKTVELSMTLWPDPSCRLQWVTDEVLDDVQARQDEILQKWRLAVKKGRENRP